MHDINQSIELFPYICVVVVDINFFHMGNIS